MHRRCNLDVRLRDANVLATGAGETFQTLYSHTRKRMSRDSEKYRNYLVQTKEANINMRNSATQEFVNTDREKTLKQQGIF